MTRKAIVMICCALVPLNAFAAGAAKSAGRAVGQFGAGVGEGLSKGLSKALSSTQPQWITIKPRSRDECLAEANGEVNVIYMRCRHGRQELVRTDDRGNRVVLSERPIPYR